MYINLAYVKDIEQKCSTKKKEQNFHLVFIILLL